MTTLIPYEQPNFRYAKRVKRIKAKRPKARYPRETLFDRVLDRPASLLYLFLGCYAGVILSRVPVEIDYLLRRQAISADYCLDPTLPTLTEEICGDGSCSLRKRMILNRISANQVFRCETLSAEPVSLL